MSPPIIAFLHSFSMLSMQANLLCWRQLQKKLWQPSHVDDLRYLTHYLDRLRLLCPLLVHVFRLICLQ